jgi:Vps52 / Sac2 family
VDPFDLKERPNILPEADAPPIPSHVAQQEALPPTYSGGRAKRLPFEAVWRTAVRHLMDVCGSEGNFCAQFFGNGFNPTTGAKTHNHGKEVLALVMAKPLNVLLAGLEEHLIATGDAPGLLLLVALNAALRGIFTEGRKQGSDNVLMGFFDRINMLLWPRIKTSLDSHISGLKALRETPVGSRRLLPAAGSGAPGSSPSELGPHPLIRRYGDLSCSFFLLHRQLSTRRLSDDMLPLHLNHLHREADLLLYQRLCGEVSSSRIAQLVLLASNYNYLVHLAKAKGIGAGGGGSSGSSEGAGGGGKAAAGSASGSGSSAVDDELLHHWENECLKANEVFTEHQLEVHFPQLYALVVKKVEARMIEYAQDNGIALMSTAAAASSGGAGGKHHAALSAAAAVNPANNTTPGAPYTPQPTILQVPAGLPMPSSSIDGNEVQMVLQAVNSGWKQGLRALHDDVQRYFGSVNLPAPTPVGIPQQTIPLSSVLTKKVMQSFLSLHERFSAILTRAFGATSGNPLLKEVLPAQVILQEMRARYAPTATTASTAAGGGFGVPM